MLKQTDLLVILQKQNYLSEADAKLVDADLKKTPDLDLSNYLVKKGLLTKDLIGQALAEHYKLKYWDLNSNPLTVEQVLTVPEETARKFNVLFLKLEKKKLSLTTSAPELIQEASKEIVARYDVDKIDFHYSLPEDVVESLNFYRKPLSTRIADIFKNENKFAPELIKEVVTAGIDMRASDIHLEPQDKEFVLRLRIDGVLQDMGHFSKQYYDNILNRIKVLAHLRIDDHFGAQDGAIRFNMDGRSIDLRVSIVPTLDGQKVVLRILSDYIKSFSLGDLGLNEQQQETLLSAGKKSYGMILTTGPTGSGKTTTLYSLLKILHTPQVNTTTIEDPVEFRIPGVNQIQVNAQTGITFAKGLRSIVRQDPNIILVGEIRDGETAEIAVNAALTGHLLLSTFHATDAATAIPRLLDMGIEPFLLASTLNLIIAQRLARKICDSCRYSREYSPTEIKKLIPDYQEHFGKGKLNLYQGKGCAKCNNSGYKGRIAIYELLSITPAIQDLIVASAQSRQIWEAAVAGGAKSFFEDGVEKVKAGIISVNELLRVAPQ